MKILKKSRFNNYNIYHRKRFWKRGLFLFALIIVAISLFYTNWLARKIAQDERSKITTWANAIQKRASLVNYTDKLFNQIRNDERQRVNFLAEATRKIVKVEDSEALQFYSKIIADNTTIPVILTDANGKISEAKNIDFSLDTVKYLTPLLRKSFSTYQPIQIEYYSGKYKYYWYKDSKTFTEIQKVIDGLVKNFFTEVTENTASVPVIITDSAKSKVIKTGNIDTTTRSIDPDFDKNLIKKMLGYNTPIEIEIINQKCYIFYKDSFVLTQLRFFPYIQFSIIGLFLLISYFFFNTSRRSEQNQVWAGLAKETAHQLGTPISSLIAWIEYLKTTDIDSSTILEMEKDMNRLNTITDRFSKIGSNTKFTTENIVDIINKSIEYLKLRTSKKIIYEIVPLENKEYKVNITVQLFDWVIENLVKNAIDAMAGEGKITITIKDDSENIIIDVADTGKGIPKTAQKTIFNPGFTGKTRGWGLGLSLSKRIISNIHNGKIFVKSSTIGEGATFRILLPKV